MESPQLKPAKIHRRGRIPCHTNIRLTCDYTTISVTIPLCSNFISCPSPWETVLFALQTLSKPLRLREGLATTGMKQSVLTHCQAAFSGAKITENSCSSLNSVSCTWASQQNTQESPPCSKPGSLSHSTTNKTYWIDRVHSPSFPQAGQNQLWKTHEKDIMKPMIF